MSTEKPRPGVPVIGLGVLAAAIALTGVGVVASGAADPSHPSSLRVAQPVPTTATSQQPTVSPAPLVDPASSAPTTPPSGTTATPAGTAAPEVTAATQATQASTKPRSTPAATAARGQKPSTKPTDRASSKPTPSGSAAPVGAKGPGPTAVASSAGAVAGNYPETTTGTATYTGGSMAVNGTPTLTVTAAQGQAQTQTTADGNSTMVEKLVFGTNRVDATEISISSQVIDADFVISPQEPIAELTAGATWSWKADSTDGKEHLALTGSYAGTEQVVVGGVTETAAIIKSTLTVTGSLATTITETDDYDPAYKLIVRDHMITKGSYDGIAYTIDSTTTLNSLKPS